MDVGGRLILVEHFSPAEKFSPVNRLEWALLDSLEDPGFSIPTTAHVREQLIQAGFRPLPNETILSDHRIVFQAYKETQSKLESYNQAGKCETKQRLSCTC